jgi:uncharacterized protein
MRMRWHDLLFLHYPITAALLRPLIPGGLELETFDGSAWLGVIPFTMSGIRLRGCPPVPGTAAFAEINVRTYVRLGERTGVWFFSLDAASRLAVRAARWWFGLPYHDAEFVVDRVGDELRYRNRREGPEADVSFDARYGPAGGVSEAKTGTIEAFLVERYCLFSQRRGRLMIGEIDHQPWPLQLARATIERNTMAAPIGLALDEAPAFCHFARSLDVVAWSPLPLGGRP